MQLSAAEIHERLEPLFRENFEKFDELGAALSIWQDGKPILDLYCGFRDARREKPWTDETLVLIWSATKGIGTACVLHLLQEHAIDINQQVAEFWPEFAQAGKEKISLAQLLSHQANTVVAARNRPRLSRPHLRVSSRRTRAPHRWKNLIRLLATKFCPAAQSRSLDRLARKGESAHGDDLRCEKR